MDGVEGLKDKFIKQAKLYDELYRVCENYVRKNNIRTFRESFYDFFLIDEDTVGLLFVDENYNESDVYTSVKIDKLLK